MGGRRAVALLHCADAVLAGQSGAASLKRAGGILVTRPQVVVFDAYGTLFDLGAVEVASELA